MRADHVSVVAGGHNSSCTACPISGTAFTPTAEGATTVDDCYILDRGYAAVDLTNTVILTAVTDYTQVSGTTLCPVSERHSQEGAARTTAHIKLASDRHTARHCSTRSSNSLLLSTCRVKLQLNYYCPGGSPAGAGVPRACENGLVTNATGAGSADDCAALPGYTYSAATNSPVACADGYYKVQHAQQARQLKSHAVACKRPVAGKQWPGLPHCCKALTTGGRCNRVVDGLLVAARLDC